MPITGSPGGREPRTGLPDQAALFRPVGFVYIPVPSWAFPTGPLPLPLRAPVPFNFSTAIGFPVYFFAAPVAALFSASLRHAPPHPALLPPPFLQHPQPVPLRGCSIYLLRTRRITPFPDVPIVGFAHQHYPGSLVSAVDHRFTCRPPPTLLTRPHRTLVDDYLSDLFWFQLPHKFLLVRTTAGYPVRRCWDAFIDVWTYHSMNCFYRLYGMHRRLAYSYSARRQDNACHFFSAAKYLYRLRPLQCHS